MTYKTNSAVDHINETYRFFNYDYTKGMFERSIPAKETLELDNYDTVTILAEYSAIKSLCKNTFSDPVLESVKHRLMMRNRSQVYVDSRIADFLVKEGHYDIFISNAKAALVDRKEAVIKDFITAFGWRSSPEGYQFWSELYQKLITKHPEFSVMPIKD